MNVNDPVRSLSTGDTGTITAIDPDGHPIVVWDHLPGQPTRTRPADLTVQSHDPLADLRSRLAT